MKDACSQCESPPGFGYRAAGLKLEGLCVAVALRVLSPSLPVLNAHLGQYRLPSVLESSQSPSFLKAKGRFILGLWLFRAEEPGE